MMFRCSGSMAHRHKHLSMCGCRSGGSSRYGSLRIAAATSKLCCPATLVCVFWFTVLTIINNDVPVFWLHGASPQTPKHVLLSIRRQQSLRFATDSGRYIKVLLSSDACLCVLVYSFNYNKQ